MSGERITYLLILLTSTLVSGNQPETFKHQINELKTLHLLDIIFLVDGSSSVGNDNFESELGFVKKLLSDFTVSEERTKVSVVVFGSHAHVYEHADKCELLNSVLPTIKYPGSNTNTLGAFLAARELVSGGRNQANKVVFLVTDGFSNGGDPIPIADELKYSYNATIFTLGIRSGNKKELDQLTSQPNTSYLVESFIEFDLLARKALHADLKDGEYIPTEPKKCDNLCDDFADCTCGLSSGQYACRCKLGYYGTGYKGECTICPIGTWYSSKNRICSPCPDVNHITDTNKPALNLDDCFCKTGFTKVDGTYKCEAVRCSKLKAPENGYFVRGTSCPNVLNNACGVRCEVGYSLRGNSIRLCRENGQWDGIEPQCHLKTCPRPPIPVGGKVNCTNIDLKINYNYTLPDEMPVDTECDFNCSPGYIRIGSLKRICLPVAQWDGLRTTCKPVRCTRLSKISHGKATEECTKEKPKHGAKCTIKCDKGYTGPGEIECIKNGKHGAWSFKPRCLDKEPPELRCPEDIRTIAIQGASYGIVSWKEPFVTDNSGDVNIWWEPSSEEDISGPHKFEIGKTNITYYAVDAYGNSANCSFYVHVIDNEPPIFETCESPPPYLVGGEGVYVDWDEPLPKDNSGSEITVSKSQDFGPLKEGVTPIIYVAIDEYNNTNTCIINITVQISTCETEMPNVPGDCNEVPGGVLCVLTCEEGYAFPVTDKATCDHNNPVWHVPDCTPTELPEEIIGEIEKPNACQQIQESCKSPNCEVLNCEEDNRIKRQIEDKKTRFRLKVNNVDDMVHRFKGVPINGSLKPVCRNGTIPARAKKLRCVRCPKGTYHNTTTKKCELCGIDKYNNKIGSMNCENCPLGRATRGRKGSKSIKACKVKLGGKFKPVVRKEPCRKDTCRHGKCIPVGTTRHKCICEIGWIGARCRIQRINHCATKPCLNEGTCTPTEGSYKCTCPTGFLGESCEMEDQEADQPLPQINFCSQVEGLCENGGRCLPSGGGYKCICPPGFIGRRCQVVPCDYRPCSEPTICTNVVEEDKETTKNSFKCVCPEGRSDPPSCLTVVPIADKCEGCENNGTCSEKGICLCPKAYIGPKCIQKLTPEYIIQFPISGTTDFAVLQTPSINLNELTICSWIETNNTFNYGTILSYANQNSDNAITLIDYAGLTLWINGKYVVTNAKINDGTWHHICFTWTSLYGDYIIFVDSIIKASGTGLSAGKSIQGGGILVLGQEQDNLGGGFSRSESFVGKISYVEFWSRKFEVLEVKHQCGSYEGGDFVSWAEFKKGIKGNARVLSSHFCTGCEEPKENVNNGELKVSEDGSTLTLNCHKGHVIRLEHQYPLSTSILSRQCTASGRWQYQDKAWFCVRVQCNQPPRVKFGKITSRRRRIYRYGDEVIYECQEGYKKVGKEKKMCEEDGEWTKDILECIGVHCDPFTPLGPSNITIISEHVYDEDFKDISRFEVGTVIEISCTEKQSLLTCLENRTWDGQIPNCSKEESNLKPIDCIGPNCPKEESTDKQNKKDESSKKSITCTGENCPKEKIIDTSKRCEGPNCPSAKCVGSNCPKEEITDKSTTCKGLNCTKEEIIYTSKICEGPDCSIEDTIDKSKKCEEPNCLKEEITKASKVCEGPECLKEETSDKFKKCEGINCTKEEMTDKSPICEGPKCLKEETIDKSKKCEGINCSKEEIIDKATICDGPNCSKEATTNKLMVCEGPNCPEEQITDKSIVCDGTNCPKQATTDKPTNCEGTNCPTEQISNKSKVCEGPECLKEEIIGKLKDCKEPNCSKEQTTNTPTVCFGPECLKEEVIDKLKDCKEANCSTSKLCEGPNCPKEETIECEGQDCSKESKEAIEPGCEGVEAPSVPNNGYLTDPDFDNFTRYDTGDTLSYRCRNGYVLVGINSTVCLEDGSWSKPNISCDPVKCPNPPKFMNMHPKKQPGLNKFHFGNMAYYECDVGFSFYGNNVARCQANGRWSRVKGKCARISCGKPTSTGEDETIIGSSYLYKDSLHIMCPTNAARDSYEAKCTHSGQWLYLGNCHTPKEPQSKESTE